MRIETIRRAVINRLFPGTYPVEQRDRIEKENAVFFFFENRWYEPEIYRMDKRTLEMSHLERESEAFGTLVGQTDRCRNARIGKFYRRLA